MKALLSAGILWLALAAPVFAFSPEITVVERPYEIVGLEGDTALTQEFLGELSDYPVMYEIEAEEAFTLRVMVQQPVRGSGEPVPFSLIAIRQNDRGGGVSEVGRLRADDIEWVPRKSAMLGMTFWEAPPLEAEVGPGTYRVEISTPVNEGQYLLTFGPADDSDGYFTTLGGIRTTQAFFGKGIFSMLLSSYVYYPLGIILLLILIQRTWKYRALITKQS
jgi:hypothetical protein